MLPGEIFFFFLSFSRPVDRRKLPSSLILINLLKKFPGSAAASALLLLLFLFRVYASPVEREDIGTIKILEITFEFVQ